MAEMTSDLVCVFDGRVLPPVCPLKIGYLSELLNILFLTVSP